MQDTGLHTSVPTDSTQDLFAGTNSAPDPTAGTVFSAERTVQAPSLELPEALKPNTRLKMDGLEFLSLLPAGAIPVAFFDPQYRGVLEKLSYGNEGKSRGRRRSAYRPRSARTREEVSGRDADCILPEDSTFKVRGS